MSWKNFISMFFFGQRPDSMLSKDWLASPDHNFDQKTLKQARASDNARNHGKSSYPAYNRNHATPFDRQSKDRNNLTPESNVTPRYPPVNRSQSPFDQQNPLPKKRDSKSTGQSSSSDISMFRPDRKDRRVPESSPSTYYNEVIPDTEVSATTGIGWPRVESPSPGALLSKVFLKDQNSIQPGSYSGVVLSTFENEGFIHVNEVGYAVRARWHGIHPKGETVFFVHNSSD